MTTLDTIVFEKKKENIPALFISSINMKGCTVTISRDLELGAESKITRKRCTQ